MEIHELVWTDENKEHIAEHHVTAEEVEELIFQDAPSYRRGPAEGVYYVYGQSAAGRYLFVVLRYLGRNRGRVITAREMTKAERRLYRRQRKG